MHNNRTLATKFGFTLHQVRRWAVAVLGLDPRAGRADGVERTYTVDEAFMISLAGHLVTQCGMIIEEAKDHVLGVTHRLMLLDVWPDGEESRESYLLIFQKNYALKIIEKREQVGDTNWGQDGDPTVERFQEFFIWISFPEPVEVVERPKHIVPIGRLIAEFRPRRR
jgi:hypothetical protein